VSDDLDAVRQARAFLASRYDPDDRRLRQLLAEHPPIQAVHRLTDDRQAAAQPGAGSNPGGIAQVCRAPGGGTGEPDGARIVIPEDPDWPAGLTDLAELAAAPAEQQRPAALCLWVRGSRPLNATLARSVTVTGSRAATSYGVHVAAELGWQLAGRGWTVLATAAFGIDATGLRGALAGAGTAVAVLPHGVDRAYPTAHTALLGQLTAEGLLVSAYPPGTPPHRGRFIGNTGLLAALTCGTVVVEASRRSTALYTLRHAIGLGRPAMLVPGPVTSATSAGCHQALRQHPQARLVTGVDDILAELTDPPTAAGD
jgi:DNA processing protein